MLLKQKALNIIKWNIRFYLTDAIPILLEVSLFYWCNYYICKHKINVCLYSGRFVSASFFRPSGRRKYTIIPAFIMDFRPSSKLFVSGTTGVSHVCLVSTACGRKPPFLGTF